MPFQEEAEQTKLVNISFTYLGEFVVWQEVTMRNFINCLCNHNKAFQLGEIISLVMLISDHFSLDKACRLLNCAKASVYFCEDFGILRN